MLIFAIDDEPKSLSRLHKAIAEAAPEAEIMDFHLGTEAIRAIEGDCIPTWCSRTSRCRSWTGCRWP